jgi:hypothetical protein
MRFNQMKFLVLMLIMFPILGIYGCQSSSTNSTAKTVCPNAPSFTLDSAKVSQINISSSEIKQSGMVSGKQSIGYAFSGKKGQRLNYQVNNPNVCLYLYGPDSQLLTSNTLSQNGKHIAQIENSQGAGSFDITMSLLNDTEKPTSTSSSDRSNQNNSAITTTNQGDRPDPSQFLKDHYQKLNQAIQDRNYDVTWNNLSNSFRSKIGKSPDVARREYEEWWNSVRRIDLQTAETISSGKSRSILRIRIIYNMNTGRTAIDKHSRMFLVWDEQRNQWLIDDRK